MTRRSSSLANAIWAMTATWGEHAVAFASLLVLARLLTPADFGAVALAGIIVALGQTMIQLTINQAVVQYEDLTDAHLSSTFWAALGVGIVLALVLVALAGPIGDLMGQPLVTELLPWMAAILPMVGLMTVPDAWMMRQMRFRTLAGRSAFSIVVSSVVAVALAASGWGLWALVAQQVSYVAASAVAIWWVCPWRPRFSFDLRRLGEIASFGKYVSGHSLVGFVSQRGDVFVIGLSLGATAVGLFNVGQRILKLLLGSIAGALARVLMSSYSRLQREPERLAEVHYASVKFSSLVFMPLFIGVACTADQTVAVLLGHQWREATEVVRFLALSGVAQSLGYLNITVVVACGRPQWQFYLGIVFATTSLGVLVLALPWGLDVAAAALCASVTLREPATYFLARRLIPLRAGDYLRALAPASLGSLVMALSVVLAARGLDGLADTLALPILVAVGGVAYLGSIFLLTPSVGREAAGRVHALWQERRISRQPAE